MGRSRSGWPLLPGAEPFTFDGGEVGVLLLHGFTGCPQSLRPWGEALRDAGLRVHCPLLPGHGTHWRDLAARRWPEWAATVEAGFQALAADCRTVVVGALSFGGALALHLAASSPPKLAGVVAVNPWVRPVADWRVSLLPALKQVLPTARGVGNDLADSPWTELAYDRVPLKALASVHLFQAMVRAELGRVRVPLRLYVSRQDHVIDPANARLVARAVGSDDVELIWLERSYHVATLDLERQAVFDGTLALARQVAGAG
jgi:carboxylesterase